jgi:DNA-binding GntR family transcriptional regulator
VTFSAGVAMVDELLNGKDLRPSSASLIRILEDDILNSVLKPGDRLEEQALALRFEVSRTPVREALRHLASSGLLEIRKNQGATVKRLTTAELIEMFQVMAELEGLSARLCARRMSPAEFTDMKNYNEECAAMAKESDHEAFFNANNMFHEAIFRGSHNGFLQAECRKLRNRVNVYRRHITFQPRRMQNTLIEHARIIEAIDAGDEEASDRLMREHVDLLAGSAADVLLALEKAEITA